MKILLPFLAVAALVSPVQAAVIKPAKITASSSVVTNPKVEHHNPELAADGKINTNNYWASDFKSKAKPPHWVEFDFGKSCRFNQIKLDMIPRYNNTVLLNNFKLEYFDGTAWKLLVEKKGYVSDNYKNLTNYNPAIRYAVGIPDAHPVFTFAPVTGSKVRLISYDPIARLDEMTVSMSTAQNAAVTNVRKFNDGILRFCFTAPGTVPVSGFTPLEPQMKNPVYYGDRRAPDNVRRYLAYGEKENRFSLPLKPGLYRVFAMSGDYLAPSPGAKMFIDGKAFFLPSSHKVSFFWDEKIVEIKNSPATLSVHGRWLLNALIIAPVEQKAAYRKAVEEVMGSKERWLRHDPQPTHTAPFAASESQQKAGFVFFAPSLQQRIFPETTPKNEQVGKALAGRNALDTVTAMSLAFRSLKFLPDFSVKVEGLDGLKTSLHPVRVWPQKSGHKGSGRTFAWVPEILTGNQQDSMAPETTRQYYLLITVPANAKPGKYTGVVKAGYAGGEIVSFPVSFEVLPIKLSPLEPRQYVAIYDGDEDFPLLLYNDKWSAKRDPERLADMRRHNMNSVFYPPYKFDPKAYPRINRMLDEAGFPRLPMAHHYQTPTDAYIKEVQETVKKHNMREILFYPVDEPHFNKRHLAEKYYPMIKKVPGTRTYSTVSQQDVDAFGKSLDVRAYMIVGYGKFEADRLRQECQRDGKTFWWYSNAAREYPAVLRFKAGFFAYRCGSTGQAYWAYHGARKSDEYNDFDTFDNDHCAVYVIGGKLCSTIQWEAIREGLDDLRYIYTLEDKIAANPGTPAAAEGKKLLNEIKGDTVVDLKEYKKHFGSEIDIHQYSIWTPEKYDEYRSRLQDAILKFK